MITHTTAIPTGKWVNNCHYHTNTMYYVKMALQLRSYHCTQFYRIELQHMANETIKRGMFTFLLLNYFMELYHHITIVYS